MATWRLFSDYCHLNDEATVNALRAKHPIIPVDIRPAAARQDYTALQITQDVIAVIKAFSAGSSGGPDGVRP